MRNVRVRGRIRVRIRGYKGSGVRGVRGQVSVY